MWQFLLGLAIASTFFLWQQQQQVRRINQLVSTLQNVESDDALSLPVISRLRRAVQQSLQYQEKLANSLQINEDLLMVAPVGYLQVDEEDRLIFCNQQARELLNTERWRSGEPRLLLEVVHSYELDQLIVQTRDRQSPEVKEWVFHPVCLEGAQMREVRSLLVCASSLPLPEGQVGVFIQNQQTLRELRQSRNQWFSDLAHELRTPLTSINLVAEFLQGRISEADQHWLKQMSQQTKRLIELVQNWLELSQLEKDPFQTLQLQLVDLGTLAQNIWQSITPLGQTKGISLRVNIPAPVYLKVDPARLEQVFLNLFHNSIKHSPLNSEIYLEINTNPVPPKVDVLTIESDLKYTSETKENNLNIARKLLEINYLDSLEITEYVEINIIDAGQGFKEVDLPFVFERFYRGDSSRQRQSTIEEPAGSGLGLAIVQQIILAHHGSIAARNHPTTGGAWLQITLPKISSG